MSSDARPTLVVADAVRVWGGAERFVVDTARGLGRRGWKIYVLAYPASPLARGAQEAQLEVHTARTRANGAPWTVLPLRRWLSRVRADILLTTYDKDLRTAGLAARLAGREIAVVHSRECDVPLKDRPHIRWFHTHVADHVLFNSQATARTTFASAPWLLPGRTSILPKGIDVEAFARSGSAHWARRERAKVVGFAGQLVPRKQLDLLLASLARLERDDWELRVAGRGPEGERLRALADRLGIAPRVRWCGFVHDMPAWLQGIDLFVQPSREEGWGYVLAEAAAAGRRIVALDRSSAREVLGNGEAGDLVGPEGPEELAKVLGRVMDEDDETRSMRAERARTWARTHLTLDRMLDRLETRLMSQIVDRRRRFGRGEGP